MKVFNMTRKYTVESSVESLMDKVSTRLRDILDNDFSNRKEASSIANKSEDSLLNYINGKSIPPIDTIISIVNHTGINIDWLIYGKGEKYIKNNIKVSKGTSKIHVYDVALSAGDGNFTDKEEIQFSLTLSKELMDLYELSQTCIGAYIKGNSMSPKLTNGDIAIIDKEISQFKDDGIYAFNFDNHCYIKQLQKIGKNIKVKSINPQYESWDIASGENFSIVGKLKAIISKQ